MSLIEGLLPSTHITAEHAASRMLLIVSEVRLLREGIAESIEGNSALLVAGTCEKLTELFGALHEYPGAMVLLDAAFPDGLEALKAVRAAELIGARSCFRPLRDRGKYRCLGQSRNGRLHPDDCGASRSCGIY